MFNISQEQIDKAKAILSTSKTVALKTAKYGFIFGSGVLVGTIAGIVLFFKIDDGTL